MPSQTNKHTEENTKLANKHIALIYYRAWLLIITDELPVLAEENRC